MEGILVPFRTVAKNVALRRVFQNEGATSLKARPQNGFQLSRSGRIAILNLDTARIREQPSTTMPGTVDKIIPSPRPSQPEKAQIAVDRNDHRHRDLRIENTLTDEHGDD